MPGDASSTAISTDIQYFRARVLAIRGAARTDGQRSDPGLGSIRLIMRSLGPVLRAVACRQTPEGDAIGKGGQEPGVTRPRRVTDTFRRTPIGWPLRVLGARWPLVTSGPPARRPRAEVHFVRRLSSKRGVRKDAVVFLDVERDQSTNGGDAIEQLNDIVPINSVLRTLRSTTDSIRFVATPCRSSSKSASKIGSRTNTAAVCTT